MATNRNDTLKMLDHVAPAALQAFGERAQMVKAIEELAELSQMLAKRLNNSPVTDDQIIDEIADALIMVNQMRFLFGAPLVDSRMIFKMNRTANLILDKKRTTVSQL